MTLPDLDVFSSYRMIYLIYCIYNPIHHVFDYVYTLCMLHLYAIGMSSCHFFQAQNGSLGSGRKGGTQMVDILIS